MTDKKNIYIYANQVVIKFVLNSGYFQVCLMIVLKWAIRAKNLPALLETCSLQGWKQIGIYHFSTTLEHF